MAVKTDPLDSLFGAQIQDDSDVDENAVDNIRGGPCRLISLTVENGAAAISHVKLYNHLGPTVGGTAPALVIPVPASVTRTYEVRVYDSDGNYEGGHLFKIGLSYACVQEAGTAGTTAPASAVKCWFTTTDP